MRESLAIVLGGVLGALCFLVVIQEAFKQGLIDLDTNAGLGLVIGAVAEDVPRRGFAATLVLGVALALVQRGIPEREGRHLAARILPLTVVVVLLWGLVLCPLLDQRYPEVAAGIFGRDAGAWALPAIIVAAFVFALVVDRVSEFVRDIAWWTPKHFDLRESLEEIFITPDAETRDTSLELPEQGTDDRGKRARG